MQRLLSLLLLVGVILGFSEFSEAGDRKLKRAIEQIIVAHETYIIPTLTAEVPDLNLVDQVVQEVKSRVKAIGDGKYKIPDSIELSVNRLLRLIQKIDVGINKNLSNGATGESQLHFADYAAQQARILLSLIQAPKKTDCFYTVEYNSYRLRTEIDVTCNARWDELIVEVMPEENQTVGEIASITRGYQFGALPDYYSLGEGSTSCTNHLSSCVCVAYPGKPGGTGGMALGIYDNPGAGLPFRITVKRRGKEIDFEDFVAFDDT